MIASLLARIRRDPDIPRLVKQGLRIGSNVRVGRQVYIGTVAPELISIGDDVIIGMGAALLSHDNSMKRHIGYTRVGRVTIGDCVYIGANAVVLPGVTIGDRAVIGAGTIVSRDVPPGVVAAGNPMQIMGPVEQFVDKHQAAQTRDPSAYVR